MLHYVTMLRCLQFQLWSQKNGWKIDEKNHAPDAHIWGFCLFSLLGLCEAIVFGWCFGIREIQTAHCSTKRRLSQATLGFWTGDLGKHFWFARGSSKRKTCPEFLQVHQQMKKRWNNHKSRHELQQLVDCCMFWYVLIFFEPMKVEASCFQRQTNKTQAVEDWWGTPTNSRAGQELR